jgi:hypothetical protein
MHSSAATSGVVLCLFVPILLGLLLAFLRNHMLGGQTISQLLPGLMHITFVLNIVALENVPGFVAPLLHRYSFAHASPDQIARCRAPEVVKQSCTQPYFLLLFPIVPDLHNGLANLSRGFTAICPCWCGRKPKGIQATVYRA